MGLTGYVIISFIAGFVVGCVSYAIFMRLYLFFHYLRHGA
jgi:hypothetical protein